MYELSTRLPYLQAHVSVSSNISHKMWFDSLPVAGSGYTRARKIISIEFGTLLRFLILEGGFGLTAELFMLVNSLFRTDGNHDMFADQNFACSTWVSRCLKLSIE